MCSFATCGVKSSEAIIGAKTGSTISVISIQSRKKPSAKTIIMIRIRKPQESRPAALIRCSTMSSPPSER
ncbi:hypothetical protein D3C83_307090 [compost metagenome]